VTIDAQLAVSPILAWLQCPRVDRGIRFARDAGGWDAYCYEELGDMARRAGGQVAAATDPGSSIAIIVPTGPDFVAAFYGALLAGCTPCPIAPPGFFQDVPTYRRHLARVLRAARPGLVVTDSTLLDVVSQAAGNAATSCPPVKLDLDTDERIDALPPADLALLQFTSGSSGTPKGARVTFANLEANVDTIARWSGQAGKRDIAAWLPLYHDMGLIGCLLTGVSYQSGISFLRPDQFVREPARWIKCFDRDGAGLTATPTFGLAYAAKRCPADALSELDLSGFSQAIIGAERVDAGALHAFAKRFEHLGFDPRAFAPAYGMAEATLAVTGTPVNEEPTAAWIDPAALRFGHRVRARRGSLEDAARSGRGSEWLVSSGRPLAATDVSIVDDTGNELGEGGLGEIVVRGPSVVDGYEGSTQGGSTRFAGDRLYTGDAGFMLEGELYVLGRMGDAISTRGRTLYLEDLEARLSRVPGIPTGRCVVIAGQRRVVALVEAQPGAWIRQARDILAKTCGPDVDVSIYCGDRGCIQRTSSGKTRRNAMWRDLLEGQLAGLDVTAGAR